MPDRTPDPDELGATPPTAGGRRSGLDRLRAARGATPGVTGPGSARERVAGADDPVTAEGSGGVDRSGSTALLESPGEAVAPEGTSSAEGSGTPAAESDAVESADAGRTARGRRGRRRSATSDEVATGSSRERKASRLVDPSRRPASRGQLLAAVVLGLLVIGLLVPVIAMRHRIVGQSREQKAITKLVDKRTEATSVARRFAVTFFSPDYKTIDAYSDQVAAQSTGDFQKDFNGKRGQLKSLLTQVQSQATGRVLAAGASKVSGNTVEVLVVADQDVKNSTTKGQKVTNRYRVRITLQQSDKGWLVTALEPVV